MTDFLEITVSDPVKQGEGVNAFVSYRVTTRTNLPRFQGSMVYVVRRFSDFVWLHERLVCEHRGVVVPPLPEKNVVEKFRFSAEFIEARRRGLDSFLQRVGFHPLLRESQDLLLFLEASEDVLATEVAKASETTKLITRTTNDISSLFKGVQASFSSVMLGSPSLVEPKTDEEAERVRQYASVLEGHLQEAQRQALRLVKKQKEYSKALSDMGDGMKVMAEGEREGGNLRQAFTETGQRMEGLSQKVAQYSAELVLRFEEGLKERVRVVAALKAVLDDREKALTEQEEARGDLQGKRIRLERLKGSFIQNKDQRIAEAEAEISEADQVAEEAKKAYAVILERMKSEVVRFQKEMTADLAELFRDMSEFEAKSNEEMAAAWKTLLPTIAGAKPL